MDVNHIASLRSNWHVPFLIVLLSPGVRAQAFFRVRILSHRLVGGIGMPLFDPVKILIIEDEIDVCRGMATYFSDSGYQVLTAGNGDEGLAVFRAENPDVVFTDLRMPVLGGLEVIKAIKGEKPDTPIIVISGTGVVKDAVEALRAGAWDFVEKPLRDFKALEHMLEKALENRQLNHQVLGLKQKLLSGGLKKPATFSAILTGSPSMMSIFQYIEVIAPTRQPILISGETGTGKELFAQAVHAASERKGDFVGLNVAGLDDQMFSDTLFGHVRGAFTGADRPREGLIAKAAGGTLFLDEIGDLKEQSQIKLLRLLQEGEFFPLGADRPRKSDARIVLATHRDLKSLVAKETFRQDLYYRLFAHLVAIPPLRERKDDIPLLLDYFLQSAAQNLGKKKPTPPPELAYYLKAYEFPGNVRELGAMVYEAVARHTSKILSMESFLTSIGGGVTTSPCQPPDRGLLDQWALGGRVPTLEEAENFLVGYAMQLANNNQGIASSYLGINRTTLNKKLQKRKSNPA
jgi:DNA-binding NtrC family response regulator